MCVFIEEQPTGLPLRHGEFSLSLLLCVMLYLVAILIAIHILIYDITLALSSYSK